MYQQVCICCSHKIPLQLREIRGPLIKNKKEIKERFRKSNQEKDIKEKLRKNRKRDKKEKDKKDRKGTKDSKYTK